MYKAQRRSQLRRLDMSKQFDCCDTSMMTQMQYGRMGHYLWVPRCQRSFFKHIFVRRMNMILLTYEDKLPVFSEWAAILIMTVALRIIIDDSDLWYNLNHDAVQSSGNIPLRGATIERSWSSLFSSSYTPISLPWAAVSCERFSSSFQRKYHICRESGVDTVHVRSQSLRLLAACLVTSLHLVSRLPHVCPFANNQKILPVGIASPSR